MAIATLRLQNKSWLDVPQSCDGLRALYPDRDASWLEVKGAFYDENLHFFPASDLSARFRNLHEKGWN
jgi:hypothetical protein